MDWLVDWWSGVGVELVGGGEEGVGSKREGDGRREGERKGERDEVEWKFGISMEKDGGGGGGLLL